MIHNPDDEAHGLILVGPNEDRNDDIAACMSQISDNTLAFTYVIADR